MENIHSFIHFTCIGILCLASIFPITAQSNLFTYHTFKNEAGDSLQYRRLVSDYGEDLAHPLVIFLHGVGERGADNEAQLQWGVKNFAADRILKTYKPVVIVPQCPADDYWSNLDFEGVAFKPTPTRTMALLEELIRETIATLSIDPNRVYITGLSMGGYGTFDALSRYPDLFAAAMPVCGAGDPKMAEKFAHIPTWIFHGVQDNTVVPQHATDMYQALIAAGAYPGMTIYPDTGHFSWIAAYSDPSTLDWLFSKSK